MTFGCSSVYVHANGLGARVMAFRCSIAEIGILY